MRHWMGLRLWLRAEGSMCHARWWQLLRWQRLPCTQLHGMLHVRGGVAPAALHLAVLYMAAVHMVAVCMAAVRMAAVHVAVVRMAF